LKRLIGAEREIQSVKVEIGAQHVHSIWEMPQFPTRV